MMRLLTGLMLIAYSFGSMADPLTTEEVKAKLLKANPELPVTAVAPSPLPGYYQVNLGASRIIYVATDGNSFFAGDLYRVGEAGFANLTDVVRNEKRQLFLASLDEEEMLVFSPEKPKAQVTVFTDVDCGYCRKLHQEVPELNRMGVAIRYLAYPRAGIDSDSYRTIVSAWCADNPQDALTKAKRGQSIPEKNCDNPVAKHYRLGGEVGVTGTPTLLFDDGRVIPGYMPASELAGLLRLD